MHPGVIAALALEGKRDRALLAILLACGVRRHEAIELNFGHIQQREEHWAIVDLKGKAGRTRAIPMPAWVKNVLDQWLQTANITSCRLFRRVHKIGKAWGVGLTEKAVTRPEANSNRSNSCLGTFPFRQLSDTLAASSGFVASTIRLA